MRPVFFIKYYDKGSTILGADQMAEILAARGAEARSVYAEELASIRDSFLIFVKTTKWHHLRLARPRGNILILDVQDTLSLRRFLKHRSLHHGMIFRSERAMERYRSMRGLETVKIHQQWNPRYAPNRVGGREFRIAYFGGTRSFPHWQQLPEIPNIGEERFFTEAENYNCHISVRTERYEALFKPDCKVATAAACNANLVTTRDAAAVEVLGPDYPYYTDPDLDSVREAVEHARATFGSPVWQAGLERMRQIRESHHIEVIADQYLRFLGRFDPAALRLPMYAS